MTPHLHQHSHHCEHEHPELQSKYSQAFAKFNLHLHDEIVQEETKKIIDNHFEWRYVSEPST